METTNFQVIIESEDKELAFEESKSLRKYLENADIDGKLEIKQTRGKLEVDDAGGLPFSAFDILSVTASVMTVIGFMMPWIKSRLKKKSVEDKTIKIAIKAASGEVIIINATDLESASFSEKELLERIVSILQTPDKE